MESRSAMARTKLMLSSILGLLVLIIVLQNTEPVETRILFFSITMPRAVFLVGTTLTGFALGVLTSFYLTRRGRTSERSGNKRTTPDEKPE